MFGGGRVPNFFISEDASKLICPVASSLSPRHPRHYSPLFRFEKSSSTAITRLISRRDLSPVGKSAIVRLFGNEAFLVSFFIAFGFSWDAINSCLSN
jgi:hypothetical protein